jgi:hypothetical protein
MIAALLLIVAIFLFLFAAFGSGIGGLTPIELVYLGLACWATAVLLGVPMVARRVGINE